MISIGRMTQTHQLIEIKPDDDLSCIGSWFAGDVEGVRHMASYAMPEEWRRLFSPLRRGWFFTGAATGRAVGFIDLEINEKTGYFSYYIAPEFRGTGHGTEALRALTGLARQLGLGELKGGVEPDNAASIAALKRAGFQLLDLDEDEMFPVWMSLAGTERH
jgi:RimJ/RimL family protein N-acetyltransferase